MGGFSAVYATDAWMNSLVKGDSYYTQNNIAGTSGSTQIRGDSGRLSTGLVHLVSLFGKYDRSFGGGNISVKAGAKHFQRQFVAPTNARDAGPLLVANSYGLSPTTVIDPATGAAATSQYTGLYVQGGGNIAVTAGGDISDVYTYAQNGSTLLQTGGSATGLVLETSTGDVTVEANREINLADQTRRSEHAER